MSEQEEMARVIAERDAAVNEARMGHARLDECADGKTTAGQPLYDRISAKIQQLHELAEERGHIIKAIGAEKDELRAIAHAAQHREAAAEYRAQRIVLDAELQAKVANLESQLTALRQERAWQPIETAPSGVLLLYRPQMPERDRLAFRRVADWCGPSCCPSARPTHWAPLQATPAMEQPVREREDPVRRAGQSDENSHESSST